MRTRCWGVLILAAAVAAASCSDGQKASPTAPSGPTAAVGTPASGGASSGPASAPAGEAARGPSAPGAPSMSLPADDPSAWPSAITFPPRNEPYDFRLLLEAKYRDGLRRNPVSSYVDIEGTIVWTQEYLRYRLNGCLHGDAILRVFRQIDGFGVQPVCGAETPNFPPRNEPFDFRIQLEAKYRDGLRRNPTTTYVDTEGDIVWTQEYLRYRVSTCSHAVSVTKVFDQIDGRGVQPDCRTGGGGGGGGSVVTGFVNPNEIVYAEWNITATGALSWVLTWADASVDLDIALTLASCTDPLLGACTVIDISEAVGTNREVVSTNVRAGERYRTWVANWDPSRGQAFRIEAVGGAADPSGPIAAPATGSVAMDTYEARGGGRWRKH